MELDQIPAEIAVQATHLQGNNLFVRRERGWRGAVPPPAVARLLAGERRALVRSCWLPEPGGMRWRGAVLCLPRMGSLGCRLCTVASRDGSLKALIKNPPPFPAPGRGTKANGRSWSGGLRRASVPALLRLPPPGSSACSGSSPARRSLGAAGVPPPSRGFASGAGMQPPVTGGFLPMDQSRCRAMGSGAVPWHPGEAGLGHTDGHAAGCEVLTAVPGRG